MPIIPKIKDGYIQIPLITFLMGYFTEGCVLFWVYGTVVFNMDGFENIPGEQMVPVIITIVAVAVMMYLVFYLVSYQNKKSKVLDAQSKAIDEGKDVDEIELKRVENFHFIYKMAMFIGIIAVSAISFALYASPVTDYITVNGILDACVYSGLTALVTFVLFDTFIGRPVADGTFKAKFLDPARALIIKNFQCAAKKLADEEAKAMKEEEAAETKARQKEQAMQALAAIGEMLTKE